MSYFLWLLIFVPIILGVYFYHNKLVFRVDTLFRKGFKKNHDDYGIYCFVGKQGDGKTYSCVDYLTELSNKKHLKVITNVHSFANTYKNNDKITVVYNSNFYDIINKFTDGTYDNKYVIFYDELFSLLSKGKLNQEILNFISQLRKRKIYLVTTVQEWLEINVTFRRYVRYEVDCSMRNIPLLRSF